ncbi:redox-regulated ATPase YchF [archaeon]|nr:redox-regulated ATPase YchF [archaeon]|tara:strand:+ start:314 stop:1498 length:1185 start_codon:yes stop_codon:yes gene_type:complete
MVQISLVGKTNVGKSTFFKAATLADVEISNRSFTTIKPNTGVAYVKTPCACKDLPGKIECKQCCKGTRFVPVKLYDVAGLIEGAHEGKGLGNQFLSDAMESQALIHVVDISGSTDADGIQVKAGTYDPKNDIEMLKNEIDYWILGLLKKDWRIISGTGHTDESFVETIANRLGGLAISAEQIKIALNKVREYFGKAASQWEDEDLMDFVTKIREESKPILIAGNKYDVKSSQENIEAIKEEVIPCSAEIELALREASMELDLISYIPGESEFKLKPDAKPNEKQAKGIEFMKHYLEKYDNTGVQQTLDKTIFELLNMIVVYPVADEHKYTDKKGNILPDAHLVPKGTTAKEFAFRVHEDIGSKFISAVDCKKHQNISADHELQDGDIICIKAAK